jgi:hypothetical protein
MGSSNMNQSSNATSAIPANGDTSWAAPIDNDRKKLPPGLSKSRRRMYSKDHLELFELLDSPIWVFDIENKSMWWANEAACYLWSATDRESLCERDFESDMTKASELLGSGFLDSWLEKFKLGENIRMTVSTLILDLVFVFKFRVIV